MYFEDEFVIYMILSGVPLFIQQSRLTKEKKFV